MFIQSLSLNKFGRSIQLLQRQVQRRKTKTKTKTMTSSAYAISISEQIWTKHPAPANSAQQGQNVSYQKPKPDDVESIFYRFQLLKEKSCNNFYHLSPRYIKPSLSSFPSHINSISPLLDEKHKREFKSLAEIH